MRKIRLEDKEITKPSTIVTLRIPQAVSVPDMVAKYNREAEALGLPLITLAGRVDRYEDYVERLDRYSCGKKAPMLEGSFYARIAELRQKRPRWEDNAIVGLIIMQDHHYDR